MPTLKRLDSFDFAFQPSIDRNQILSLHELSFIDRKENVILLGPAGVGNYRKNLLMERFSELDLNMYQSFPKIFP